MKENTIRQHEQTKHQNKHWDVHIQQKLQKVEELKTKKKKKKKIVWCHSRQKPNLKVKLL